MEANQARKQPIKAQGDEDKSQSVRKVLWCNDLRGAYGLWHHSLGDSILFSSVLDSGLEPL